MRLVNEGKFFMPTTREDNRQQVIVVLTGLFFSHATFTLAPRFAWREKGGGGQWRADVMGGLSFAGAMDSQCFSTLQCCRAHRN